MYDKEIVIRGINSNYYYFIDKYHPLAVGNSGLVYYHRHVASMSIGRWLTSEEHVHHINEYKLDNDPANLQILTASEHSLLHQPGLPDISCLNCKKIFSPDKPWTKYCSPACSNVCNIKDRSITKELLDELIPKYSWVALGRMFGYSDNGIKARAKALGCEIPSRQKSKKLHSSLT